MTKNNVKVFAALIFTSMLGACTQPVGSTKVEKITTSSEATKNKITEAEVNAAQQAWCDALVAIGKMHTDKGDAKALAVKVLTEAYDY